MNELNIPINVAIVSIIGIVAFFNAIVLVLMRRKNRKAYLSLAGFFISFSIGYLLQIPFYGYYYDSISWQVLAYPFSFSATAFLYFFVQSSLNRNFTVIKNIVFFIPFLITSILAIVSLLEMLPNFIAIAITGVGGFLINETYIIFITFINLRTIENYKNYLSQNLTETIQHQYYWIRFIVIANLIYSAFPFLFGLVSHITEIPVKSQLSYITAGVITVIYLLLVIIKSIQNANNTDPISKKDLLENDIPSVTKKANQEQEKLFNEIEQLLMSTKMFTTPDLSLEKLAGELKKQKREVSISINLCAKRNFYEYINDYRIAETKSILSSNTDPKLTIMEVMYDVGYNSKSSFNTAFKSRLNMTPNEFRKKILLEIGTNT